MEHSSKCVSSTLARKGHGSTNGQLMAVAMMAIDASSTTRASHDYSWIIRSHPTDDHATDNDPEIPVSLVLIPKLKAGELAAVLQAEEPARRFVYKVVTTLGTAKQIHQQGILQYRRIQHLIGWLLHGVTLGEEVKEWHQKQHEVRVVEELNKRRGAKKVVVDFPMVKSFQKGAFFGMERVAPLKDATRADLNDMASVLDKMNLVGVWHGDVKPDNFGRTADGKLKAFDIDHGSCTSLRAYVREDQVTKFLTEALLLGKGSGSELADESRCWPIVDRWQFLVTVTKTLGTPAPPANRATYQRLFRNSCCDLVLEEVEKSKSLEETVNKSSTSNSGSGRINEETADDESLPGPLSKRKKLSKEQEEPETTAAVATLPKAVDGAKIADQRGGRAQLTKPASTVAAAVANMKEKKSASASSSSSAFIFEKPAPRLPFEKDEDRGVEELAKSRQVVGDVREDENTFAPDPALRQLETRKKSSGNAVAPDDALDIAQAPDLKMPPAGTPVPIPAAAGAGDDEVTSRKAKGVLPAEAVMDAFGKNKALQSKGGNGSPAKAEHGQQGQVVQETDAQNAERLHKERVASVRRKAAQERHARAKAQKEEEERVRARNRANGARGLAAQKNRRGRKAGPGGADGAVEAAGPENAAAAPQQAQLQKDGEENKDAKGHDLS
ncbi:unnamed protein product [Amoebophrya sp. A120]|nr:unnamed protein product [Amoebophrya sp. A120]|eukprot:GSA120T00024744001.1